MISLLAAATATEFFDLMFLPTIYLLSFPFFFFFFLPFGSASYLSECCECCARLYAAYVDLLVMLQDYSSYIIPPLIHCSIFLLLPTLCNAAVSI